MSAKSLSLKSPAVIAVVLVLMAAVAVLNIRTFGSKKHKGGATRARAQAYPVLPGDLGDLVHQASLDLRGGWQDAVATEANPENPVRDPFREQHLYQAKSQKIRRHKKVHPRVKKTQLPSCTAVLLGGQKPMALIGGRSYGENDEISGYKILRITTSGVLLADKSGHAKTLVIGNGSGTGSFTVSVLGEDPLVQVHEERDE